MFNRFVRVLVLASMLPLVRPALGADVSPPATAAVSPVYLLSPNWARYYLSLRGGAAFLRDTSIDYVNGAAPNRDLSFNAGWALIGAVGYRPTPWFRVELEGGGRNNSISSITPGSGASGSASATTLMLNGYIDIPIRGPVTPYVGAGFGKAWLSHSLSVDGATLTPSGTTWPWAWQVIAGVSTPMTPQWSVSVEYRYLATQRALFQDTQGLFYNSNYNSQAVLLGLTWRPQ
jgi:opacity protein-like surface antigen